MRKANKKLLLDLMETFDEAHRSAEKFIKKKNIDSAKKLLIDCQKTAVQIVDIIRQSEGNECQAISAFNEYGMAVFQLFESLNSAETKCDLKILKEKLSKARISVNNIKVKLEAVFLPYKASMWDALESVWKSADADPDCDAYVVPIPYYERNSDHLLGEMFYEGNDYPDYVPITDYHEYDIAKRRPDIIFIHCPYDNCNTVTSIDPKYYSKELLKYTNMLVYIPYFILEEIDPNDAGAVKNVEHFCAYPGVIYSNKVILQSENIRRIYINYYLNGLGNTPQNREFFERKFVGLGSPKFDKLLSMENNDSDIPESWRRLITRSDGSRKKIIFYNIGLSPFVLNSEIYFNKIKNVFKTFKEKQDDVTLLWRPHPLMRTTIKSMKPQFVEEYDRIVEEYISGGWGIYDDSADMDRAVALSDGFYGDHSSVIYLFQKMGKPVMLQDLYVMD